MFHFILIKRIDAPEEEIPWPNEGLIEVNPKFRGASKPTKVWNLKLDGNHDLTKVNYKVITGTTANGTLYTEYLYMGYNQYTVAIQNTHSKNNLKMVIKSGNSTFGTAEIRPGYEASITINSGFNDRTQFYCEFKSTTILSGGVSVYGKISGKNK